MPIGAMSAPGGSCHASSAAMSAVPPKAEVNSRSGLAAAIRLDDGPSRQLQGYFALFHCTTEQAGWARQSRACSASTGKSVICLSSISTENIPVSIGPQISSEPISSRPEKRGVGHRHERWGGLRWTRSVARTCDCRVGFGPVSNRRCETIAQGKVCGKKLGEINVVRAKCSH